MLKASGVGFAGVIHDECPEIINAVLKRSNHRCWNEKFGRKRTKIGFFGKAQFEFPVFIS